MLIYLDYCSVFPFTGGELVYVRPLSRYVKFKLKMIFADAFQVTEMTSFRVNVLGLPRRKADSGNPISTRSETIQGSKPWLRLFLGDGLLAFITYSILFVCLFSTTSNALQFGRLVQLAIWLPDTRNKHPPESGSVSIAGSSLEANLIGFLAFTMLCLIHLWFPRAGRRINKWTAVIKLVAIVTLIIYGSVKNHPLGDQEARDRCTGLATDTRVSITSQGPINLIWARALLAVLFSFQGWENATFVGQFPPAPA